MSDAYQHIGVIGAGAWGTALAEVASAAGRVVQVRARSAACADAINATHQNPDYLPGVTLHRGIEATTDLATVARKADAILLAAPAQATRQTVGALAPHLRPGTPLVVCAKGLEQPAGKLLSEVLAEVAPKATIAILSGPTFAAEVARGLPTAATLACRDLSVGEALAHALRTPSFRPYHSADVVGTQFGGALKNVIAIACGISDGRGYGENARAALLTRGLAEISRLAVALGADPRTIMGLSGLGDLSLTCASNASRNYALGHALGRGTSLSDLMTGRRTVAEGVHTAPAVVRLATTSGKEVPICSAVDNVLQNRVDLDNAIHGLLDRPLRREDHGN